MLALVLSIAPTPAAAQAVDWSTAGGDLFGRTAQASQDISEDLVRVPPLSQPLMVEIEAAASAHNLDPKLLHALVLQESHYRPDAVSPAGAVGLTQLMPDTAFDLGVKDRFDPVENLNGGAAYLAQQMVRFQDLRLALAAFNAGPARVARLGRVPEIAETRQYVAGVLDCYLALTAGRRVVAVHQCRPSGGGSW